MRHFLIVLTIVFCASHARAAEPELSLDTKRMLAYGTLAVMVGACKTKLTPEQNERMQTGLEDAADKQTQLTEDQFTDMMKAAGAQIGQNLAQVCAALTPDYINTSLEDAAAGK